MRRMILTAAIICSLLARESGATLPDLMSLDWSVKASHNLATNPPADDAIGLFLSKADNVPRDSPLPFARFADLEQSGTLSLVVFACAGRSCGLNVIDKTAEGLQWYDFDVQSGIPKIKDLNGDGNRELIVPTDFGGGDPQHCTPHWPVIYAWTGNGYGDVSRRYKAYYEQRLASLKDEVTAAEEYRQAQIEKQRHTGQGGWASNGALILAARSSNAAPTPDVASQESLTEHGQNGSFSVQSSSGVMFASPPQQSTAPSPDLAVLDCTKAEVGKIERFLGIWRDAGMAEAIRWANSEDPEDRQFAGVILADIATPEAVEYLKILTRDPDRAVAAVSKISLKQALRGPTVYDVERESHLDESEQGAASNQ